MKDSRLYRNKHGYYSSLKEYSQEELEKFYADKYFQNEHAQYSSLYSAEEKDYFLLAADEICYILDYLKEKGKIISGANTHLDIGCGEGWLIKGMRNNKFKSLGIDYGLHGVKTHNPELVNYVIAGSVQEKIFEINKQFDLVTLKNVLEHALDPEIVLANIKHVMKDESVLVVYVPNDFSELHHHLIKNKLINEFFFVHLPEHLHYFTSSSLNSLMSSNGFECIYKTTDFPIDFDLLTPETSYYLSKKKGKMSHKRRVATELYIGKKSIQALSEYHRSLANAGMGRTVINYYQIKRGPQDNYS